MKALLWFLRAVLFVVLLGLAIKNSGDVELRFYFDARWQLPLSMVVLLSLVTGVVMGLLALLPQFLSQRRSMGRLQERLRHIDRDAAASVPPTHAAD